MRGERTYDDPCAIARGLDAVGERWALLVVRELLLGPKRFSDLRRGLHDVSQNVLAQRLRELERDGIVRRRTLASTGVYELTKRGRELEPVLFAIAGWANAISVPESITAGLSPDALAFQLRLTFDPKAAGDVRAVYELRLDDDRFTMRITDRRIDISRAPATEPDAVIETSVARLTGLLSREQPWDDSIVVEGDKRAARRLTRLFTHTSPS
ncbi:winged helix-turn-helix transcriptional regulator [Allorhizocola rhizosphaerae]|uniref:winged helix-turn-helix transcriptional regulator n=1 Tax=Allorhizocola rhizosphaerae TaxID=1872709 RepID=UPI000E3B70C1|nr:helix-turn-helix domain-containing protein [Allorhizocola rhizosphaerae]